MSMVKNSKLCTAHLEIFGSKEDHKWQFLLCVHVIRSAIFEGVCGFAHMCVCVLASEGAREEKERERSFSLVTHND